MTGDWELLPGILFDALLLPRISSHHFRDSQIGHSNSLSLTPKHLEHGRCSDAKAGQQTPRRVSLGLRKVYLFRPG